MEDNNDAIIEVLSEIVTRLSELKQLIEQIKEAETAPIDSERPIKIKEAAALLGFAPQTIYGMTHRGEIPHFRKRGRLYFEKKELLEWVFNEKSKNELAQQIKLEDLNVSVRAKYALKNVGIKTIEELSQMTKKDFSRIRNVGQKTITELTELLKEHGMNWKS